MLDRRDNVCTIHWAIVMFDYFPYRIMFERLLTRVQHATLIKLILYFYKKSCEGIRIFSFKRWLHSIVGERHTAFRLRMICMITILFPLIFFNLHAVGFVDPQYVFVKARLDKNARFYNLSLVRDYDWRVFIAPNSELISLNLNGNVYRFSTNLILRRAFSDWNMYATQMGLSNPIQLVMVTTDPTFTFRVDSTHTIANAVSHVTYPISNNQSITFYTENLEHIIPTYYSNYIRDRVISRNMDIASFTKMLLTVIMEHELGHMFSLTHSAFNVDQNIATARIANQMSPLRPSIMTVTSGRYLRQLSAYLGRQITIDDVHPSNNDGTALSRLYQPTSIPDFIQPVTEVLSSTNYCYNQLNISCSQLGSITSNPY